MDTLLVEPMVAKLAKMWAYSKELLRVGPKV